MSQQKKRRRQKPGRFLSILILIFAVLVVFEGKLLINIFRKEPYHKQVSSQVDALLAEDTAETESNTSKEVLPDETETTATTQQTEAPIDSAAVVPAQSTAVDDSYFSDAVFIGDSRMEGFRNVSGLTQGTFLTGVGMNVTDIFTNQYIHMYNEQITVFQALYNTDYKKVYIMLGTNNLGEHDFNDFKRDYDLCLGEIKKQLPDAEIYVLGVIYVDETKVTTGDYVTNANIDIVNEKIIEICEESGYHYVNVNEVLSDGNHSLISAASSDGIHLYQEYCAIWLDYLKTHYISDSGSSVTETTAETESQTQTETASADQ